MLLVVEPADPFAKPPVLRQQLPDQRFGLGNGRAHERKKLILFGPKVRRKTSAEKFLELPRALLQSLSPQGFQSPQRLLAAAQRERETVMMVVRQRN